MEKINVIDRTLAAKKIYDCPRTEVLQFTTALMQITGEASVLPGPGGAPARRSSKQEEAPVF